MEYPLISAIMLAGDYQQKDLDNAIQCFKDQLYPSKELILVNNKFRPITDPNDKEIKLATPEAKLTTGMARNFALSVANGQIIAQFDPNYWYAPNRITAQLAGMLKDNAQICLLSSVLQYSLISGIVRLITNKQNAIIDTMMFVRPLMMYQNTEFGAELALLKQMISSGMKAVALNMPEICCRLCLTTHDRTKEIFNAGIDTHLFDIVRESSSRWVG